MFSFSVFRAVVIIGVAVAVTVGVPPAGAQHVHGAAHDSVKKPPAKKPAKPKAAATAKRQSAAKKPAVRKTATRKNDRPKTSRTRASKAGATPRTVKKVESPDSAHVHHHDATRADSNAVPHTRHADTTQRTGSVRQPGDTATHAHPTSPSVPGRQDPHSIHGVNAQTGAQQAHAHSNGMMIGPAGVSMTRMGSGTTWIPDAVTLPSRDRMLRDWMIMTHGFVFLQYDKQTGDRGDEQFGSLNWAMVMASRDIAGGHFQARTMLSLDPLTVTNQGYPLLLQTGETYQGRPLHDRQHPHDFWMELGVLYQREINRRLAWSIYAAPVGEPALSPVAFMHRPSAMDNPAAPLGHHWQDATHVSFGVLTAGLFTNRWQLEASIFNGREPDESRWNIEPIKLDSYSGRVTVNPTRNWSLAAGYGFMKSPELLEPDESMRRITASILHGAQLTDRGQIASAFVWGANKHGDESEFSNSFLVESEAIFNQANTIFGRAELVNKSAGDLVVEAPFVTPGGVTLPGFEEHEHFNVGSAQLGFIRDVARFHWSTLGIGAAGTVNFVPGSLEPYYGSRNPVGVFVFLRMRPFHSTRKSMGGMEGMKH